MSSKLQMWALPIAILAITNAAAIWHTSVSKYVPDPYLDEVFHVPQAQRYCESDYSWDPKITTPPGLYLMSLLLGPVIGSECDTSSLRMLNLYAIVAVCLVAYYVLRNLRPPTSSNLEEQDRTFAFDAHSALNIALFPPLFFFSGLYYTDVVSTLLVLVSYSLFLKKSRSNWTTRDEILSVLVGIAALSFRQTNIFWVAVFPAGLAVVEALKEDRTFPVDAKQLSLMEILRRSSEQGRVYDLEVHDAGLQDYILFSISVVLAAVERPLLLLKVLFPYLILLVLFAGFVAWNGGVVLGDKSNHVATIHMPQMLYIWPYIAFFSFPLFIPSLLAPIVGLLPESQLKSWCQRTLIGQSNKPSPGILSAILFVILGLTAVHYNTIVHPFTLADNRHYVFYVFRILRQHPVIKYLAVLIYYPCAWMTIQTLGLASKSEARKDRKTERSRPKTHEASRQLCPVSFILVWLATTTLSVISAPLVEPRYFIIPWIIWRVHVPYISALPSTKRLTGNASFDMRLVLETTWHLAINAITGYIFLYRDFAWPSEPNRAQRFLW